MGAPSSVIQPLQKVFFFFFNAARFILMAPPHHHSTHLLKKLHWLPFSEHIKYKVAYMWFHAKNGSGPTYLSELLHIYNPSGTLRSSSDSRMLKIPQYKRETQCFRTFTFFGPYVWNSLPQGIRQCSTLPSFKTKLKTFLFHSTSVPFNFRNRFSYRKLYLCVRVCICARVCVLMLCVCALMCIGLHHSSAFSLSYCVSAYSLSYCVCVFKCK